MLWIEREKEEAPTLCWARTDHASPSGLLLLSASSRVRTHSDAPSQILPNGLLVEGSNRSVALRGPVEVVGALRRALDEQIAALAPSAPPAAEDPDRTAAPPPPPGAAREDDTQRTQLEASAADAVARAADAEAKAAVAEQRARAAEAAAASAEERVAGAEAALVAADARCADAEAKAAKAEAKAFELQSRAGVAQLEVAPEQGEREATLDTHEAALAAREVALDAREAALVTREAELAKREEELKEREVIVMSKEVALEAQPSPAAVGKLIDLDLEDGGEAAPQAGETNSASTTPVRDLLSDGATVKPRVPDLKGEIVGRLSSEEPWLGDPLISAGTQPYNDRLARARGRLTKTPEKTPSPSTVGVDSHVEREKLDVAHDFKVGARVLALAPEESDGSDGGADSRSSGTWVPGRVLAVRGTGETLQYKVSLDGYDSETDSWVRRALAPWQHCRRLRTSRQDSVPAWRIGAPPALP